MARWNWSIFLTRPVRMSSGIAVDSKKDAAALAEIRRQTTANLSVDLQENYRLARDVAPHVDKVRYNPGHLYHHEQEKPWQQKVAFLAQVAADHDCAMRVGVNCGSVDPDKAASFDPDDSISPMLARRLGTLPSIWTRSDSLGIASRSRIQILRKLLKSINDLPSNGRTYRCTWA